MLVQIGDFGENSLYNFYIFNRLKDEADNL